SNSDHNGWTWVFGKNKHHQTKPIDNPYVKDVEKIATSFFVTNFPNSLDAKNLWKEFQHFGRIVDAFIANKRSKQGTWSTLISNDMDSNESDDNHDMEEHRSTNEDVDPNAALDEFIQQNIVKESALKDSKEGDQANVSTHVVGDNETLFSGKVKGEYFVTKEDKPSEEDVSDTSKPPGFEYFIKENSECSISSNASRLGKCSTSFGNYKRKKLKGFSFIDEMSRMIKVGGTLGYEVKGCKKSLRKMINGIETKMTKLELFQLRSMWGNFNFDYGCSMARGRSGGLVTMWDPNVFIKKRMWCADNYIIIEDKWDDITGEVLGHTRSLHTKLKDLKSHLKIWYSHTKGVETSKMNLILADMRNLDQIIDEGLASDEDKSSRISKLQELDYFEKMNSLDLMQKERVKWEVGGDENSKFFHGLIKSRRKSKLIHGIMHEGVWLSDLKDIKEAFLNFYKKKFSCHDSQVSFPSFMPTHHLNTYDQDLLEAVFSMEEIKTAVWDCGSNKAPGPDGYSFFFIKRFWDLLKHEIQEFVVNFFSSRKFPQGVNSGFITLIPKVSNPLFIKDYRPISLIGFHYKIVAKILSNRLSKVIDSIISLEQSAFISGR
nr:RNA-directed DNA polymerase, eukaryota [Tanacetum cinerariifolium]